jgi:hypothetical protein
MKGSFFLKLERVRRDGGGAIRNELPDQDEKRKI